MSEAPWLTPDEATTWMAVLEGVRALFGGLDQQLQRDADMTHAAYGVLVVLGDAPDHTLYMGELAERARFSASAVSHLVRRLEQRAWVRRSIDPENKRRMFVALTPQGLHALRDAAPGHVRFVRQAVFDGLSERELRQLAKSLRTINERVGLASDVGSSRLAIGEPGLPAPGRSSRRRPVRRPTAPPRRHDARP